MSRDWLTSEESRAYERDRIIEECAKVVEGWSVPWQMVPSIAELTAAIRALKDRP